MSVLTYKVTPTITAGAYSANDVIGGRLRFQGMRKGTIDSISVWDNAAQSVNYELVLFESIPTNITDNATFDIADADGPKIFYQQALPTTERQAYTDNCRTTVFGIDQDIVTVNDDVWGFLYTTGTPTYAATSDITVVIRVRV